MQINNICLLNEILEGGFMKKIGFIILVIIIFCEMLNFNMLTHSVHTSDDVLFVITTVIVTLVLGVTGLSLLPKE